MKPTGMRVVDLLAAIRSPEPTPGGGSASALSGALGASLLAMVAAMPKHRAASDAEVERLHSAGRRCTDIAERLTTLVDEDTDAYAKVMTAYRLPKASEAEKTERSARIQAALRLATDTPLEVMRQCALAMHAIAVVAALGNPNAASDTGVARELLAAGLRGARLNVEINLEHVTDSEYADRVRREAEGLEAGLR